MSSKLLIVDDDQVLRETLGRAFRSRDFEVRLAANYDEAMAEAKAFLPTHAIVDLKMPEKSGLELTQSLSAEHPDCKIVVLTGYGSIATAIEAIRVGATYYVHKPADADDILAAFDKGEGPPLATTEVDYEAPSLARAEWEHINRVLTDCGGNISEAARRLGVHRRTLQRKLQKYPPNK